MAKNNTTELKDAVNVCSTMNIACPNFSNYTCSKAEYCVLQIFFADKGVEKFNRAVAEVNNPASRDSFAFRQGRLRFFIDNRARNLAC